MPINETYAELVKSDDIQEFIMSRVNRCDLLELQVMAQNQGRWSVAIELREARNS